MVDLFEPTSALLMMEKELLSESLSMREYFVGDCAVCCLAFPEGVVVCLLIFFVAPKPLFVHTYIFGTAVLKFLCFLSIGIEIPLTIY